jgi:DNA-binding MarR family transcriptional regulator
LTDARSSHILHRALTINDPLTSAADAADASPDAKELAAEILEALAAARGAAAASGYRNLVGRAVSMTHMHVLATLRARGPMRMSELAEALDVSVANVTGIVNRMEERALVERLRDAGDRRVVIATLSEEGRRVFEEMDRRTHDFFAAVLSHQSVDELTQLRNGMRAVFREAKRAAARKRAEQARDEKKERPNE